MEYIKHNKFVYRVFYRIGSLLLGIIGICLHPKNNLILFNSFGGKKFDDSPKEIYELMKKDERFKTYDLVWAFHNPDDYPEVEQKIKSDSISYFIQALQARCWISNSSIQRGLNFKGKRTYSFNTWHGTPLKKMGKDSDQRAENRIMQNCDAILAQSVYEIEKMSIATEVPREKYLLLGLPRNDRFASITEKERLKIREELGLSKYKRIILYTPTFRDYLLDGKSRCCLDIPIDFEYWERMLGENYLFLIRAHYEIASHTDIPQNGKWKDVSSYHCLSDLMIASDILISDYSSIFFDYSILNRPMFHFTYDYEEYEKKRGLYFDIRTELSGAANGYRLADLIANMNEKNEVKKCSRFRERYVEAYGNSTMASADWIYKQLQGGE